MITLTLRVTNQLQLFPVDAIRPETLDQIRKRLSFDNPAYIEKTRMGFWTGSTPREILGYRIEENVMILPRGTFPTIIYLLNQSATPYRIADYRRFLDPVDFHFQGELHNFQNSALETILKKDFGTLSAPTGSGKTVIALAAIAKRWQPALIVVHTQELMQQWVARIGEFLNIPSREVGQIGGGRFSVGKEITVALVQTLCKCAAEIAPHIGHLIPDECHRCPSRTFAEAVAVFDSRYMLGLSATPWRRDGLTKLISWYIGSNVCEIGQSALVSAGHILQADVEIRRTDFFTTLDASSEYSSMLTQLAVDFDRNCLIIQDVIKEANNGSGVCLVLTDRKNHCDILSELLEREGIKAEVLTGDLGIPERRRIVEDLNNGLIKVLVATGQLIGEGFDCKSLSTLFLAMPIKFNGRLIQYLGRVLRPAPGKTMAKVYDYVDQNVGVLANSARGRKWIYARNIVEAN